LRNARHELDQWRDYEYVVVRDRIEQSVAALQVILAASQYAVSRHEQAPWNMGGR